MRGIGIDAAETAWGIREIAREGMIKAVRSLLNARGLDARELALVSFGGCGSLFSADLAQAMGSRRVLVPELASVLSAFGAATADIRRDRVQSLGLPMPVDSGALQAMAEKLGAEVEQDLVADGVAARDRTVSFEVDLRFKRQISELSIPLPRGPITTRSLERLADTFREEYASRYGQGAIVLGAPMELVTLRAVGIGRTVRASLATTARSAVRSNTRARRTSTRAVRLARDQETTVDVFEGPALRPGHRIVGPALIDGSDTTIWIPPRAQARVDERATLIVEVS